MGHELHQRCLLVLGIVACVVAIQSPAAAERPCDDGASLLNTHVCDPVSGTSTGAGVLPVADDGFTYSVESACKVGDERCAQGQRICRTSDGKSGTWFVLIRTDDETGDSQPMRVVCLEQAEARAIRTISPAMVRRAFERLDWPTSDLQLQPPDGQTLINFDTNFFTDNTTPTTRTVTLLGQQVEIEATPSEYTWDFGDGASESTSSPGAAYPDLDVTHEYASEGRVSPSVATTYQGRYRINGGGWQQIPGTLTLQGDPEALRVRSASPRLVGTTSY